MTRSTPDVMSLTELAKSTGYDRDTIKRWIRKGQFPGYMPSEGVYVVTRQMYERWLTGDWQPAKEQEAA